MRCNIYNSRNFICSLEGQYNSCGCYNLQQQKFYMLLRELQHSNYSKISTIVEILYAPQRLKEGKSQQYLQQQKFYMLLRVIMNCTGVQLSTIVEILYAPQSIFFSRLRGIIYNSRNFICSLEIRINTSIVLIYNSRNFICSLERQISNSNIIKSTIVEILYAPQRIPDDFKTYVSTIVEILYAPQSLYRGLRFEYLQQQKFYMLLRVVVILHLTLIYNSRNFICSLESKSVILTENFVKYITK